MPSSRGNAFYSSEITGPGSVTINIKIILIGLKSKHLLFKQTKKKLDLGRPLDQVDSSPHIDFKNDLTGRFRM